MGLFDGATVCEGSTADLAELSGWPVVLVIDAHAQAASAAAVLRGFASHRPQVRIAGVVFNRVGSELMQQLEPAPASTSLRQSMLERLDSLSDDEVDRPDTGDSRVPRCLRQFVADGYDGLRWKRVSPDIYSVELCRDSNGARVELLKIRPGGSASTHTHLGDEYTVILEGSFSDESGVYGRGDFVVKDSSDRHTPVATQDQECICLAVTEGPIQLTGFFGRLLNPLLRRGYA